MMGFWHRNLIQFSSSVELRIRHRMRVFDKGPHLQGQKIDAAKRISQQIIFEAQEIQSPTIFAHNFVVRLLNSHLIALLIYGHTLCEYSLTVCVIVCSCVCVCASQKWSSKRHAKSTKRKATECPA